MVQRLGRKEGTQSSPLPKPIIKHAINPWHNMISGFLKVVMIKTSGRCVKLFN